MAYYLGIKAAARVDTIFFEAESTVCGCMANSV